MTNLNHDFLLTFRLITSSIGCFLTPVRSNCQPTVLFDGAFRVVSDLAGSEKETQHKLFHGRLSYRKQRDP
jgi:hypothetical protein